MCLKRCWWHDKFHVCKHLDDAVDGVRGAENKTLGQSGDDRLKGAPYLFLKRTENLSKGHRERLQALRNSNLNTARAWAIKEEFTQFWSYEFGHDAKAFFDHWYSWAIRSRLKPLKEKARMLKKYLEGLLSYVLHPITRACPTRVSACGTGSGLLFNKNHPISALSESHSRLSPLFCLRASAYTISTCWQCSQHGCSTRFNPDDCNHHPARPLTNLDNR